MLILRLLATEQFGACVLLLTGLALPEWPVDFGQTDIVVWQIGRHRACAEALLTALLRLRVVQSLLLAPLLAATAIVCLAETDLTGLMAAHLARRR